MNRVTNGAAPALRGTRPPVGNLSSALAPALLGLFRRVVGRPRIVGHGQLPSGPFVICANHRSHVDSLALICGLGLEHRCALLGARDYFFEGGWARHLLALPFPIIPVERRAPRVAMRGTISAADGFISAGGRALITYPEGARQTGASIAPFKRGAATLALALGLPTLPVFIEGTDRILAKGRYIPIPGPITLALGSPIDPGPRPAGACWRARSLRLIKEIEASVRGLAATLSA